jgi:hypothetical protein
MECNTPFTSLAPTKGASEDVKSPDSRHSGRAQEVPKTVEVCSQLVNKQYVGLVEKVCSFAVGHDAS